MLFKHSYLRLRMHFRTRTNRCLRLQFECTTQINFRPCPKRKVGEDLYLCLVMEICFCSVPLIVKGLSQCHFLWDCLMTWWHLHLFSRFIRLAWEMSHEEEAFDLMNLLYYFISSLFISQVILLAFFLCLRFDLMRFQIKILHFLILPKPKRISLLESQFQKQE